MCQMVFPLPQIRYVLEAKKAAVWIFYVVPAPMLPQVQLILAFCTAFIAFNAVIGFLLEELRVTAEDTL